MLKPERVYFHYEDLEEYKFGMWKITNGDVRKAHIEASADLMKTPDEFKAAMVAAIEQWPNSCLHNFTADGVNKIAWLGHAGCCMAVSSPEDCTRTAWHTLSKAEQDEANRVAAEALETWLPPKPEAPMMFQFWSDNA
jgi:hypothetical protein